MLEFLKQTFKPKVPDQVVRDVDYSRFLQFNPARKNLKNIWDDQRDNKHVPSGSCNVSALASALSLDQKISDDKLWEIANSADILLKCQSKYKDAGTKSWLAGFTAKQRANTVLSILEVVGEDVIGGLQFCEQVTIVKNFVVDSNLIKREIDKGYPVIILGAFSNPVNNLSHYTLIVGYDEDKKCWIVNDSWGNMNTLYRDKKGDHVEYSYEKFNSTYISAGKKNSFLFPMALFLHPDKRIPVKV